MKQINIRVSPEEYEVLQKEGKRLMLRPGALAARLLRRDIPLLEQGWGIGNPEADRAVERAIKAVA